jgi:hypothetical protein
MFNLSTMMIFLLGALLGAAITYFLKGGSAEHFVETLLRIADIAVRAVNQEHEDAPNEEKKQMAMAKVIDGMKNIGFKAPEALASDAIEAAVHNLKK